jgi:hypothetical protein
LDDPDLEDVELHKSDNELDKSSDDDENSTIESFN